VSAQPETSTTIQIKDKQFSIYLRSEELLKRIQEMGQEISEKYADKNPLFIVVLNGAFMFASDLMKTVQMPAEVTFIRLNSYTKTQSTGNIKELIRLDENVFGRHLIILEDIVDTGQTMQYLVESLSALGPKSIEVACLLHKPEAIRVPIELGYVGFNIPDKFVVGYGLDYDGQGRNLNDLYSLEN
jgi:hypoxanthine phosphoribosyltransferase